MLSISNLHAAYGKVEVLHGISLEVPKGKLVTLIGSNGAGKTTTMRAISGMIKPKGGKVTLDGKDITGHDSHKIARAGLAHSPEGRRVFASMSVTDNLLLGAFPRFTRAAEGRHQARPGKSAGTVPAPERTPDAAGRHAVRRRAADAGHGARRDAQSRSILLDEPSMGLAPILVEEVFRIIQRLKSEGVTMLLVEQFAAAALNVADYGYVLENGSISVHGPAESLKTDPKVIAAYLGGGH
jgi:branched-chain amino acid transport system ATP-binding protein